jgi:hypothetical protein
VFSCTSFHNVAMHIKVLFSSYSLCATACVPFIAGTTHIYTHSHTHTHTYGQGDIRIVLRAAISMNKRRFIDKASDINLDLTYICDRLIAMALPCVADAVYRNDIRDVAHFFSSRHYGRSVCLSFLCPSVCPLLGLHSHTYVCLVWSCACMYVSRSRSRSRYIYFSNVS